MMAFVYRWEGSPQTHQSSKICFLIPALQNSSAKVFARLISAFQDLARRNASARCCWPIDQGSPRTDLCSGHYLSSTCYHSAFCPWFQCDSRMSPAGSGLGCRKAYGFA